MELPEMINAGAVVLKRWEPGWAETLATAVRQSLPELIAFMPWAHEGYDADQARVYLDTCADEWKNGSAFNYAIFTATGELVGACSLMTRCGPGALEIGYWVHSAHTNRGYASTAAVALARVALTVSGIERVIIKHDVANPASGAVAARAGFTQVDRVTQPATAPGESGVQLVWHRQP